MKESEHQESLEFFRRARAKGLDGVRIGEKPKLSVPSGLGRTFGQVFANALLWGIVGLCASYVFYIYFPNVPDLYSSDKRLSAYYKASDIGQLVFSLRIFWPSGKIYFQPLQQQVIALGRVSTQRVLFHCLFHARRYSHGLFPQKL